MLTKRPIYVPEILIFNKAEYEQMGIMTASKEFTKALYIHFPSR